MEQGFYCVGQYALLPKGFSDFSEFRDWLTTQSFPLVVEAVCLHENNNDPSGPQEKGLCLAPYFLTGYSDEPVPFTIPAPDAVYPAEVERMDQKTYNNRLREIINEKCPGCTKFKPLSKRDISLNGHFSEMTLDGSCIYRCEVKPSPRRFKDLMRSSLSLWNHNYDYSHDWCLNRGGEQYREDWKDWMYAKYSEVRVSHIEGEHGIIVQMEMHYKPDFFLRLVTDTVARNMKHCLSHRFSVVDANEVPWREEDILPWLAPEKVEAFKKGCKKYGMAIGLLRYDPEGEAAIMEALKERSLEQTLFPLCKAEDGGQYALIADIDAVLLDLRYHAPLLSHYHTKLRVYDLFGAREITVSRLMEQENI